MEGWDADLLLQVIQFLNVRDAGRLALMSRRCYYLVHHYRTTLCRPQLVVGTSPVINEIPTPSAIRRAVVAARDQCQLQPQLALSFERSRYSDDCWIPELLPNNTVVLGAISEDLQVTLGPDNCNFSDNAAVMLLSGLSEEDIALKTFCCNEEEEEEDNPFDDEDREDWKLFIIYGCSKSVRQAEALVKSFQSRFPDALIVGGICESFYVSVPIDQSLTENYYYNHFQSFELLELITAMGGPMPPKRMRTKRKLARYTNALAHDGRPYRVNYEKSGVGGVALAGNVPVRSVVSRGVRSVLDMKAGRDGTPPSQTALYVHEATAYNPGDLEYNLSFEGIRDLPTYHLLTEFRDAYTGKVYMVPELPTHGDVCPDFIGLRGPDQDGFTLIPLESTLHRARYALVVVNDDVESFVGYNFDLYNLSGDACVEDMDNCMIKLVEQTQNETILGALMFTCNKRGPKSYDFLREIMPDATRFANTFPKVPCLGFYAARGGIGPCARAGQQSVFPQGSACRQRRTAVFAVFAVPKVVDRVHVCLEDEEASIAAFVRRRCLGGTIDSTRTIH